MRANNNKASAASLAILLGVGTSALHLQAYNLIEPVTYWPIGNVEWQVKLAGNGTNIPIPSEGSPLLDGSTSWGDAFERAVNAWRLVIPDYVLTLSIVKNSALDPAQGNGVNNVGFSPTVYGQAWGGSTAGISISIWSGNLRIENDVLFNSTKTWNAYDGDLQGNTTEFVRVAMHELGHSLGLDHPDDDGQTVDAIMNSVSSDIFELQEDDINGISVLYGQIHPVTITRQPLSHTTPIGGTWPVSVAATGSEPITFQWELSTNGGDTWAPVEGLPASASSYSYPGVQMSQNGWQVRVNVTNSVSYELSTVATLTVTTDPVAPAITTHPVDASIAYGDNTEFTVAATGSPTPSTQWQTSSNGGTTWSDVVDGKAGPTGPRFSGATTSVLRIEGATDSLDGSLFRAKATSTAGSDTSNVATLTVADPIAPIIINHPLGQDLVAGNSIYLEVYAVGSPLISYQWRKNGVDIPGAIQNFLQIDEVAGSDAGTYTVVVSNFVGSVTSNNAVVTVDVPLAILQQPASQYWVTGSSVTISVVAQGNGTVTYQWRKNGEPIAGATATSLAFPAAVPGDSGDYTVVVSNLDGNVTSSVAKLTVFDPIPIESRRIAAAGGYTLLVEADGTLKGAGEDTSGGMATGDDTRYFFPITIGTGVAGVYATSSSLRVNLDGTLWVTGLNNYGQLGVEPFGSGVFRTAWVQLATGVATAESGGATNFFLKQDGTLWGMGLNNYGQMGVPNVQQTTTPVQIATGIKAVSSGYTSSAFIKVDGSLWAMGLNQSGQIGVDTGSADFVFSPVHVADDVIAVSVGGIHMLFLKANGEMWATGGNSSGQLGDGTTTNRTTPVKVADGVAKISAGDNYSLFVKTDGSMWATGWNAEGQLGLGDTVQRLTPELIAWNVTAIAAGGWHSIFLKGDEPWGMGRNIEGTLGDGSNAARLSAVRIFTPGLTPALPSPNDSSSWSNFLRWLFQFLSALFGGGGSQVASSPNESTARAADSSSGQLAATPSVFNFILYGRFREEVLLTTPAGRYYTDLYERMSPDVIRAVVMNPSLIWEANDLLIEWAPAVQAVVDGNSGSVPVTDAMIGDALLVLQHLRNVSIAELGAAIDAELAALNPATLAGGTMTDVMTRMNSQVYPPPAITAQPTAKTVVIGSDATFTVQPTGAGPFTYQWKRNGANITGATNPTLTVSDVQPGGGGNYSVVVSNPFGSTTSSAATLALDTTPRLINVSCLASAGVGDATLVAGFFIKGSGSKTLLIRGIGPRLTSDPFNRTGVVADPQISVYDKDGVLIASNDNWDPILAADFSRMGAFGLVNGSLDAALKVTLPGNDRYTVHLVNNGPIADGLIEVYDFSRDLPTRLSNVSCRIAMKAGETVILGTSLIANPVPVLASAVGPGLANYGIPIADVLPDPDVRIYGGSTEIAFNEDWNSSLEPYFGPAGAFPLTAGSKDAVARVTFSQGGLTIHATGKGQSGVAIIQLFESPEPP